MSGICLSRRKPLERTRRLFVEQLEVRRLLALAWDGAPNGGGASANANWTTSSNWNSDIRPTPPISDVQFPAGAANLSNFNDFSSGSLLGLMLMTGSGYTLQGNAVTMFDGITSQIPAGTSNTVSLPIALTQDVAWSSSTAGSTLDASGGSMDLRGFNLVVSGAGNTILGPITDSTDPGGTNGVRVEGGNVVLSADNTTDAVFGFVHAGTLKVLGSAPKTTIDIGGGTLTTDAAATTGPITAIAQNGGTIAPGGLGTAGILSTQGDVVMSGQGFTSFAVDLNGATAGIGFDALHVTGTATLGGAVLNVHTGFGSEYGNSYTIVTATAGVSGTFYATNDLGIVGADGRMFQIHYTATSVVLTDVTIESVVNMDTDEADANTSDGLCDTSLATPGLQCTLRAAIQQTNASAGADVIRFNIPGTGVHTISPTSELPTISDPLTIEGYTQPGALANTSSSGFNGQLLIELSGVNAGNASALKIAANNTIVRGLVINRFSSGSGAISTFANPTPITGLQIEGNLIGTNATGTAALANQAGIGFSDVALGWIGGKSLAARNVIAGNIADGIVAFPNQVLLSSTFSIQGNFIGLAADGASPLGNGRNGIFLTGGSQGITIGGTAAGTGNTIAFNNGRGVLLQSGAFGIPVLSNAIFGNGGPGIDLNQDGPTPNDDGDTDGGANNLQNFPEISYATRDAGKLKATYKVPSAPGNSVYPIRVEFFLADATGQGKTYLGFNTFTNADFTAGSKTVKLTTNSPIKARDKIVATATDDSGRRNTSEFSPGVQVVSPWQNPGILRWDVDNSTTVEAADVLAVINYINAQGSGLLPENAANQKPYLDVDGDNNVVAADVVDIINYINAGRPLGGEAEAVQSVEAANATAGGQMPVPTDEDVMLLLAAEIAAEAVKKRK